jgi:hypothetical protein
VADGSDLYSSPRYRAARGGADRDRRRIEIGGATQKSAPAFIQNRGPVGGKRAGLELEAFVLLQKRLAPASRREALDLAFGTLREAAEPAKIVIPSFAEQEDVDLMVGDADTSALKEIDDGAIASAVESGQIVEAINRNRKVDVSTLVENFDSMTPEGLEAGDFAHQRPGQRAEQRHRAHLFYLCKIRRYRVGGATERGLPREHEAVLFRDLSARGLAGHGSVAV